jgi:hypothetical protein
MKNFIKIFFPLLALLLVGFLAINIARRVVIKKKVGEHIVRIPAFCFVQLDNKLYSDKNIRNDGEIIVNYFDPDCNHCQYMTSQIVKQINLFSKAKLLMITNSDSLIVKRFFQNYHLEKFKNIIILRDPKSTFYGIFGNAVTPSFYIYKKGVLAKVFLGETKIINIYNVIK